MSIKNQKGHFWITTFFTYSKSIFSVCVLKIGLEFCYIWCTQIWFSAFILVKVLTTKPPPAFSLHWVCQRVKLLPYSHKSLSSLLLSAQKESTECFLTNNSNAIIFGITALVGVHPYKMLLCTCSSHATDVPPSIACPLHMNCWAGLL